MSWAFQLNDSFSKAGPPYLCLCGSVKLAIVGGQSPASMSLSAITTAVTMWMAAWLTMLECPQIVPFQPGLNFSALPVFVCFFE